ncbi:adenylyl cyclase-associated protein 1-like [Asterias amurensis]|uniref:adenylyl cyclase-associated protein 1-like n=1 Tax=Asterias amurensis TaxID=7602 RepID=UPI003AB22B9F
MADISNLVSQLTTLSSSIQAESAKASGKIDGAAAQKLNNVIQLLQSVARGANGETPAFVSAFDEFVFEHVGKYLTLSNDIGGDVASHAALVKDCYAAMRDILVKAAGMKRPGPKEITGFFKSLNVKVEAVIEFADKRRADKNFINHFMTVKEGIGCIGWVTVEPKPAKYVKEMYDQGLFYGNRVIKDYKGKDDKQVEWMRAFMLTIKKLEEYITDNCLTGILWNVEGGAGAASVAQTSTGDSSEALAAFDAFVSGELSKYLNLSKELGGQVAEHAKLVEEAYAAERKILEEAVVSKQPAPDLLAKICKPLSEKVDAVIQYCEKNRGSKVFNHLMTVKEGIGCVGWVSVAPKPCNYLKECYDQSLFYGNRVLKDFKGKDDKQVEWMRAYTNSINKLKDFVAAYHLTGLTWNPQGKVATAPQGAGAPPPPPPGGAPPPPPPPPAVEAPAAAGGGGGGKTAAAALFAEINQGTDITSGLKKVTKDMQTHKNPALRQAAKPFSSSEKPAVKSVSAPKAAAKAVVKPPRLELVGFKKWEVEFYKNDKDIVIDGDMKHTVYIYKCDNCTIRVNNKVNSITMDSCKKTALVFEQCLGSVDTINCQSVQMQVTNKVPIVSIDKTDGAMLYLSENSLETLIVTAKSSEMNILVPRGDGEFNEFALPEQFKSTYDGKRFVTECSESLG